MSLDLINHQLTTSTTDKKGVTTWSNPAVDVSINSKGNVLKKGVIHQGSVNGGRNIEQYCVYVLSDGVRKYNYVSFNSLFSRMVLGVKLGAKTICLKDKNAGYTKDNVSVISTRKDTLNKQHNKQLGLIKQKQQEKPLEAKSNTNHTNNIKQVGNSSDKKQTQGTNVFYTEYKEVCEHITEDGAVFPTLELAQWHQEKVSKGKGNAQVVLDYNGGYVLAEQIYLQEVIYNRDKPYANFIDVLNNTNGIVSNVQKEHCKFDKVLTGNIPNFSMLMNLGLSEIYGLEVSKFKAVKIQEALEVYDAAQTQFNDSVNKLKSLLKDC